MDSTNHIFPIDAVLPKLKATFLSSLTIVLSAPPGAGKTTRIPPALLDSEWLTNKKILMLEPRRLAARRAAEYMSDMRGEKVGATIGYRIRGESVVGKHTNIEIVTEGILTRMIQQYPDLHDVGLIIFDEFHERSIHADLGLALALDVQKNLRNDLRLLIMSATLDGMSIAHILENAAYIESKGKSFPVTTHYAKFSSDKPMEIRLVETIHRVLHETEGDILVFLPGRREIRKVEILLWEKRLPDDIVVHSLYGDASYQQQSAALSPAPREKRKIILSTSVAETSLTIDGVRVVIDSGLARSARFDVRRGMSGLVTLPVSKAIADQRRGRSGRQQAGMCYRLWTEAEHESLPDYPQPEIKTADLAPLALEFAEWGTPNGENLQFLDPPPAPHLLQAQSLLKNLDALDDAGKLTRHGRAMAEFPLHPRLSHMILRGKELNLGSLACEIAALLEERDILAGKKDSDIDLGSRLNALHEKQRTDEGIRERIAAQSKRLQEIAKIPQHKEHKEHAPGILLALAYPERVARLRDQNSGRYQMANGSIAILPQRSLLSREEFLAIGETDGMGSEVHIYLASPITKHEIEKTFYDDIVEEEEIRWNSADASVLARSVKKFGAVILAEQSVKPHGEKVLAALIDGIKEMGLTCLSWDKESRALQQRCEWLRSQFPDESWPDISEAHLIESLDTWLAPFLDGVWKKAHLQSLHLLTILESYISKSVLHQLDRQAPKALNLPSGSTVFLDYSGTIPVLAVRLQELFGQTDTPKICGGKVQVLIHLLSPARRPVAVTQDLRSFWMNTYPEIRTQMRARYPKHVWPEDPLNAKPTNRPKRKS